MVGKNDSTRKYSPKVAVSQGFKGIDSQIQDQDNVVILGPSGWESQLS